MEHYNNLQLALCSGKGGVGKTTVSCSLARHWAREFPQERVLLLSTDPAHSVGDVLDLAVSEKATPLSDLPNLQVRALNAQTLLAEFKERYGETLEILVERGSFVDGEDLTPAWDLGWPGLDELMGVLEIQRLFNDEEVDRIVVDMAPSGHSLHLFEMMDFLDHFLGGLEGFQEKHRVMVKSLSRNYTPDETDEFLEKMRDDLARGRSLLQDEERTACLVGAIAQPMSWLETQDFVASLQELKIPCGGVFVNRVLDDESETQRDRFYEQQQLLEKFRESTNPLPLYRIPEQEADPVGMNALDELFPQIQPVGEITLPDPPTTVQFPDPIPPGLPDWISEGRQLLLVGGKGGVGKTTTAAAVGWGIAEKYPDQQIRLMSIDPAHSLADAFDLPLGHEAVAITDNLSAQEIDSEILLDEFREEYLWELAEMMSGGSGDTEGLQIAYGPAAWRQMVSQGLPGVDEMLALLTVVDQLESGEQDLIIVDTAPTGHLLRFLEMPTALTDWLSWIFKLWMKYQAAAGHMELMTRLRQLRKRVVNTHKKLQDPDYTEFIGVLQNQSAIVAETERMMQALAQQGVSQHYIIHNRYEANQEIADGVFSDQTLIRLPNLPRSVTPLEQIKGAAKLLSLKRKEDSRHPH
ncbi:arsenite efflux ATP-binding protein ArsA [Halothece sp. PCC 7418]|uniref:ArsA family ATPase n=1 Tax=Halothece sp. (strain PCC 7418) TaxID=65093 RepID=UPI0002A074DD|nr:ArsA family ATPase [Halothece sp. PCC 7418]AFZ43478.1 arsenite efflux ATP-binding protein ArsA [Halothece sp. PCC 7418]